MITYGDVGHIKPLTTLPNVKEVYRFKSQWLLFQIYESAHELAQWAVRPF